MNGAFVHLAINHIPIVAMPFAAVLLAAGLWRRSRDLTQAGLLTLIVIGAAASLVEESGESAAHVVHQLAGVSGPMMHAHAIAAERAVWAAWALGLIALIGFVKSYRSGAIAKGWTVLALIVSLGGSAWLAYVAHLGGLVRHPEIENTVNAPLPEGAMSKPLQQQLPPEARGPEHKMK
jgi:hypothetical protein